MTPDGHQPDPVLLGGYVTGSLEAGERAFVEGHLAECTRCRAEVALLAPLPDLLRTLRPASVAPTPEGGAGPRRSTGPVPAGSVSAGSGSAGSMDGGGAAAAGPAQADVRLGRLTASVVRRRRRVRGATGAALVALAAGVVAAVVIPAGPPPAPALPPHPARVLAIRGPVASGAVALAHRAWGTQLTLQAVHLPAGARLEADVATPGGDQPVGTWVAPANGAAVVELAAAAQPGAITGVWVRRTDTGAVVAAWSTPQR